MDAKYYMEVRPQINDNHAVHKEGCPFLNGNKKRIYLGEFGSGKDAVKESRRYYRKTKGCLFCSKELEQHDERYVLCAPEVNSTILVRYWQAGMLCGLN